MASKRRQPAGWSGLIWPMTADYANDLQLLHCVLAGFDLPDTQVSACGPTPRVVDVQIIHDRQTATLVEAYLEAHPALQSRRHHALVDAEALRVASHVSPRKIPTQHRATSRYRRPRSRGNLTMPDAGAIGSSSRERLSSATPAIPQRQPGRRAPRKLGVSARARPRKHLPQKLHGRRSHRPSELCLMR